MKHNVKLLVLLFLCVPVVAFGADSAAVVAAPPPGFDLISPVLQLLVQFFPTVGPIVLDIGKWVGIIGSVMTALVICVKTVLSTPEIIARWSGASATADKIQAFSDNVMPYLKWFSVFNAQKKV